MVGARAEPVRQRSLRARAARDGGRRPAVRNHLRLRRVERQRHQLDQPAAARRHPLDHAQLLGARRLRQLRALRPSPAADRSGVRRPDGADRQHLPMGCDRGRGAAAERDRPAGAASGTGHRRDRWLHRDRSSAEAAAHGRGGARLRRAAEPAHLPAHRRDRPAGERQRRRRQRRRAGVVVFDHRRARHRHRHRRHAGRSDAHLLQPIAGDVRRRSLPADQPGRQRGHRSSAPT